MGTAAGGQSRDITLEQTQHPSRGTLCPLTSPDGHTRAGQSTPALDRGVHTVPFPPWGLVQSCRRPEHES